MPKKVNAKGKTLADAMGDAPKARGPVWTGPGGEGPNGGITQSLLSRFLCCRERFRLRVVEGWTTADRFDHKLEFGHMWHVCEAAHAEGVQHSRPLVEYAKTLIRKYPFDRDDIDLWYRKCEAQFLLYIEHWEKHPDVIDRTPLLQEQTFDVPYKLPSGRRVRLRGKWDSVDLIGAGPLCTCGADRTGPSAEAHAKSCPARKPRTVTGPVGIYIQENKSKSSIDQTKIERQVSFDLQTMIYAVALLHSPEIGAMPYTFRGVRYNVVRRSAHKSVESMLKKIEDDREDKRIGEWFARWKIEIRPGDVDRFKLECLDPILEQLYDWWEWVTSAIGKSDPYDPWQFKESSVDHQGHHWRHPFGVYNVLDEGGSSDLDAMIDSGSIVGLRQTSNLFEELT